MAYNADGTRYRSSDFIILLECFSHVWLFCRLFSCGTTREGESHIVEWNESEGAVKRMYHGLGKRSVGVVQFDTTKNRFLAAGDEFVIKFWDMDNNNLLTTTDAEGGLPVIMELHLFKYLFPSFLTHGLLQANNSASKCLRLHLAFGSVRKQN